MANDLDLLRQEIDKIDEELMQLFIKRMKIAEEIAHHKFENNLKIENKNREDEIKEKIKNHPIYVVKKYYESVAISLIKVSKKYQDDLIKSSFK
ncbi:MAG: chorismate mutase [Erysipelotrichales bacterium]|nr:chorismate mutase [Erysipelotrichales bacterium]